MTAIFKNDLEREKDDTRKSDLVEVLRHFFPESPGMTLERNVGRQKAGIDAFIRGYNITLDFKFSGRMWDTFALEYEHRYLSGRTRFGWVNDPKKNCTHICYIFKPTWLTYLIPRTTLAGAWNAYGEIWIKMYGSRRTPNDG